MLRAVASVLSTYRRLPEAPCHLPVPRPGVVLQGPLWGVQHRWGVDRLQRPRAVPLHPGGRAGGSGGKGRRRLCRERDAGYGIVAERVPRRSQRRHALRRRRRPTQGRDGRGDEGVWGGHDGDDAGRAGADGGAAVLHDGDGVQQGGAEPGRLLRRLPGRSPAHSAALNNNCLQLAPAHLWQARSGTGLGCVSD